jgi:hypothetical protein
MDLQETYRKESGYDVGTYNINNTNYYSEDYVEWLEKQLLLYGVVGQSEQLVCDLYDELGCAISGENNKNCPRCKYSRKAN